MRKAAGGQRSYNDCTSVAVQGMGCIALLYGVACGTRERRPKVDLFDATRPAGTAGLPFDRRTGAPFTGSLDHPSPSFRATLLRSLYGLDSLDQYGRISDCSVYKCGGPDLEDPPALLSVHHGVYGINGVAFATREKSVEKLTCLTQMLTCLTRCRQPLKPAPQPTGGMMRRPPATVSIVQ